MTYKEYIDKLKKTWIGKSVMYENKQYHKVIFQAVRAAINRQSGSERSRGIDPREVCESGKFNTYTEVQLL